MRHLTHGRPRVAGGPAPEHQLGRRGGGGGREGGGGGGGEGREGGGGRGREGGVGGGGTGGGGGGTGGGGGGGGGGRGGRRGGGGGVGAGGRGGRGGGGGGARALISRSSERAAHTAMSLSSAYGPATAAGKQVPRMARTLKPVSSSAAAKGRMSGDGAQQAGLVVRRPLHNRREPYQLPDGGGAILPQTINLAIIGS